jgi:hypothetical protein
MRGLTWFLNYCTEIILKKVQLREINKYNSRKQLVLNCQYTQLINVTTDIDISDSYLYI